MVSDEALQELKMHFLEAYDDNDDGKIDIREVAISLSKLHFFIQLAQLLPMEENFLLLFRFDNPLESSVEFMKLWYQYDTDGSGFIEADELKVPVLKVGIKLCIFCALRWPVISTHSITHTKKTDQRAVLKPHKTRIKKLEKIAQSCFKCL